MNFSYLKENGELLSIAQSSGLTLSDRSLNLYRQTYDNLVRFNALYPAFIRFFWAIALDLERLGLEGDIGDQLTELVLEDKLIDFETSDTRRWEYVNLLGYRGMKPNFTSDSLPALEARTWAFFNAPNRFVKFNRPLFYDVTHIIFFWTDYGRINLTPSDALMTSLSYMGLLCFLDNDFDLLAEVCLCFEFLGQLPPKAWLEACYKAQDQITLVGVDGGLSPQDRALDEYHIYIVMNWLKAYNQGAGFSEQMPKGTPLFLHSPDNRSTLSVLSANIHEQVMIGRSLYLPDSSRTVFNASQDAQIQMALESSPVAAELLTKLTESRIQFT